MKGIRVLSYFDGISFGKLALDGVGFSVEKYYACEIDEYAISISKRNHPDVIHLGDVVMVNRLLSCDVDVLERCLTSKITSKEFKRICGHVLDIRLDGIDIFMGGSPCQGFSFAGDQLAFDDPRSKLFFDFLDSYNTIREHINKDVLVLLENVKMKKQFSDIIDELMGVDGEEINSSSFGPQNRKRLYWTNFELDMENIPCSDIVLKDILDESIDENSVHTGSVDLLGDPDHPQFSPGGLCHIANATDIKGNESIKRVYHPDGKAPTVTTMGGGHREPKVLVGKDRYRKLTPMECERLQGLPDGYTEGVSSTQRKKAIGNGWDLRTIKWIVSNIKK